MKVKARHWVNYKGVWHGKDEVFSISPADAESMGQYADVIDDEPAKADEAEFAPEPARRGRKRRTEE